MRLIDADELIHLYFDDEDGNPVFDFVPWEFVENASTIEAEPIKHGRWTTEHLTSTGGGTYPIERCSECEYASVVGRTNFCPNCGADMRELTRWINDGRFD